MNKSTKNERPEVWLRGPIEGIPDQLQPAAHALVQSTEDTKKYMDGFPENLLWEKPSGRASVGFHLQHLTGVLDRLMTYAKAESLSEEQFEYLRNEGNADTKTTSAQLIENFKQKVDEAIPYFKTLNGSDLMENRSVGRKKLPTTILGLLFHAAEHSQRHVGQLLVTVSVLKNSEFSE
ncbi:DinB superfamily protein [Pricia antarctica]|uniref:DinB superfamily protein n=1 Tax=Pricia antarctica TaxID=641691 RepID=A0A1G7E8K6_9FLAO|nr:DinB family protein [Pricia antarctica]SDE60038.1 DinB superfamily protein [Pricia antarctica]